MIKPLTSMTFYIKTINIIIIALIACCSIFTIQIYHQKDAIAYDPSIEKIDGTVESLAHYLTKDAISERAKAWSIYVWITNNITYDVNSLRAGNYGELNPYAVFNERSAMCKGYSELFVKLAQLAGLQAVKISGYAKDEGYKFGQRFTEPNHAWNAVKIDNKWYLVDTTWGAGIVDNFKFYQSFEDHYFLTPPEEFIFDHLPEDPRWQLLQNPIAKEEFQYLPFLKPNYFKTRLKLKDHFSSIFKAGNSVNITLEVPDNVKLMQTLEKDHQELPENLTFGQREGNRYTLSAVFPSAGEYTLKLFAKFKYDNFAKFRKNNEKEKFDWAISYTIIANSGTRFNFPITFDQFINCNAYIYTPLKDRLDSGEDQTFKLRVPGAIKVAVISGDKWLYLQKEGDLFTGNFNLTKGEAKVFANFSEKEQFEEIILYNVF